MLDIRLIRERQEFVKTELQKVGFDPAAVDAVLAADGRRRSLIQEVERLRAHRAEVSRSIGMAPRDCGRRNGQYAMGRPKEGP